MVAGATPEQKVAQGFLPVRKDFPVLLHPVTQEEYALARTERKTAPGDKGFVIHAAPSVTLAQALARRDITINYIAIYEVPTRARGTFVTIFSENRQSSPICGTLCRFFCDARDGDSPRSPGGLAAPAYRAGAVRGAGGSLQNKRIRQSAYNPKRYTKQ